MTWNHRQPTKPHQLMHRCVLLLLSAVYMLCVCMLSENIFRKWCSLDHRRGSQPTDSKCWLDKSGQQWMDTNHDEQHQHSPWLRKVINGFTSLQSTETAGKIRNSLIAVEWYVIAVSWLCSRYNNTNNYIETYSLINAWYVDVDVRTQNATTVIMWTEAVELKQKISSWSFGNDFVEDLINQSVTTYGFKPSQTQNLTYHQQQRQHNDVISIAPIQ